MESKSMLLQLLGDYPIVRVLDFLLENDVFDYSKKDVCRNANVSWNTLETFWKQLEEKSLVVPTRKVGKAQLYKLDTSNPVVQKLAEVDKALVQQSMSKVGRKKAKVLAK
ncbi:MAG: hypothetical protein V1847_05240 [Candidatus Diapherotrites archaeon]